MRPSISIFVLLSALGSMLVPNLQGQQDWVIRPWTCACQAPVIAPRPESTFVDPVNRKLVHWEALRTFNPTAIVRDGQLVILYCAEGALGEMKIGGHRSRIGMAVNVEGIHFARRLELVFYSSVDGQVERESPGGVEDPRLLESPDGRYILTDTQWSRRTHVFTIGAVTSLDLQHWTKFGLIFGTSGKYVQLKYTSAGIVTRVNGDRLLVAKIHAKYWMHWGEGEIHLATSSDLIHWHPLEDKCGIPKVLLRRRPGRSNSESLETGPPTILASHGIPLLYNAMSASDDARDPEIADGAYTVQEALFSSKAPDRLIASAEAPVLEPTYKWERSARYAAGTIFAGGIVLFNGEWWLNYSQRTHL